MSYLILKKGSITYKYYSFDPEANIGGIFEDEVDDILQHLNTPVKIMPGFTFGDLFELIYNTGDIIERIYALELGDYDLSLLYDEYTMIYNLKADSTIPKVERILFETNGVISELIENEKNEEYESKYEDFCYMEFHYANNNDGNFIPFEYLPLSLLKDVSVGITENFTIDIERIFDENNSDIDDEDFYMKNEFTGKKSITLNDIIRTTITNLCLIGSPENKREIRNDLHLAHETRLNDSQVVDDLFKNDNSDE